jgi:hypothetical protein
MLQTHFPAPSVMFAQGKGIGQWLISVDSTAKKRLLRCGGFRVENIDFFSR